MRLERLTENKLKIFLTIDDLSERGLTKEDIWKDSLKWHQLFQDLLYEACEQFGFDINGTGAVVEIFSLHAQEVVMLVTLEENEEESFIDPFFDFNIHVKDESILFEFTDFEEVIQLSKRLNNINVTGGTLYGMNHLYFLFFDERSLPNYENVVAHMAEFGSSSLESVHRLNEYGNMIIKDSAIETLVHYF